MNYTVYVLWSNLLLPPPPPQKIKKKKKKQSIQLQSPTNRPQTHISQYQGVMLHVRHKSTNSKSKILLSALISPLRILNSWRHGNCRQGCPSTSDIHNQFSLLCKYQVQQSTSSWWHLNHLCQETVTSGCLKCSRSLFPWGCPSSRLSVSL